MIALIYRVAGADEDAFWEQANEQDAHWVIPDERLGRIVKDNRRSGMLELGGDVYRALLDDKGYCVGREIVFKLPHGRGQLRATITKVDLSEHGVCVHWNPDEAEKSIVS
jgi:hypothetical protein